MTDTKRVQNIIFPLRYYLKNAINIDLLQSNIERVSKLLDTCFYFLSSIDTIIHVSHKLLYLNGVIGISLTIISYDVHLAHDH